MTATDESLPTETTVGRVALAVGDPDAVASFYESVVGLTVRSESDDRVVLGTEERPLLVLRDAPDLDPRAPDETGLFHTALRVPSREALADALARLEADWRLTGASDHRVSEALYCSDPEDAGVEIYRDRPRESWPVDAEGGVGIATLPLSLADLRGLGEGRSTVPAETTVGHVHLEVSSIPAAREFYVDGLGFDVMAGGAQVLFVAAGGYHHHVGLNVWKGRSEPATGRGLDWFELLVPDQPALEAARSRLSATGFEPATHDDGLRVTDPDGIEIHLTVDSQS